MLGFGRRAWNACARLGALVGALWLASAIASSAHAQSVVVRVDGVLTCQPLLTGTECESDLQCSPSSVCRRFGATTVGRCVERDTVFCCSSDAGCPVLSGADRLGCTRVTGLSGGSGLCLPDREYCGAATIAEVGRCHTRPDGTLTILWLEGDCDGDGLTNGEEQNTTMTDICRAPELPPVFDEDLGCISLPTACQIGLPCSTNVGETGSCERDPTGAGTVCRPSDAIYPCCGDGLACPGDLVCAELEEAALCIDGTCLGSPFLEDLDHCVRDADGRLVEYREGDCDRDGFLNGSDDTPCGGELPFEDAGMHDDGGVVTNDAGARTDAGGGLDGGVGPTVTPSFHGGGGVSCRAAPGSSSRGLGLLASLALALAFLARRR
jgi:MYXO-CTERM domain-containing protein